MLISIYKFDKCFTYVLFLQPYDTSVFHLRVLILQPYNASVFHLYVVFTAL